MGILVVNSYSNGVLVKEYKKEIRKVKRYNGKAKSKANGEGVQSSDTPTTESTQSES